MKIYNANETAAMLPFLPLIDRMEGLFAQGINVPDRHHHAMEMVDEADATLLLMPAWDENFGCVKLVTVTPGNNARGLPAIAGSVLVFDRNTGAHLALLDGAVLTARRTAAATALGARHLSTKDASRLLLLGSGKVASLVPEALKAVRPIKEVRVWDRYIESAEKLVESLNSEGWNAEVAYDLPEAVPQADIISAATLATEPILEGRWLRDGQHVDLIGAFTPLMREADDLALQRARIYVDTSFALSESGELKTPLETGVITKDDIQGDLNSIATGKVSRGSQNEITLFKSVGNALMDLAAASFFTK